MPRRLAVALALMPALAGCATLVEPPPGAKTPITTVVAPMATEGIPKPGTTLTVPQGGVIYREREGAVPGALLGTPFAAGAAFGPLKPLAEGAPLRRAAIDGNRMYCAERRAYGGTAPLVALPCFADADGDGRFESVTGIMQPVEGGPDRYGPTPLSPALAYREEPYALSGAAHEIALVFARLDGTTLTLTQRIAGPIPDESLREVDLVYDLTGGLPATIAARPITLRDRFVAERPLIWSPRPAQLQVLSASPGELAVTIVAGFHPWRLDTATRDGQAVLVIDYEGEPEIERRRREAAAFASLREAGSR